MEIDFTITPWLSIAKAEKGTKEIIGTQDNPRIIEYHSTTTLKATDDETPWCSAFVCWCLQQAGYKHTHSAAAKSYLKYGVPCDMVLGSIAVFERKGGNHVGFVVAWDDVFVFVLGGNQQNEVNVKQYARNRLLATRFPTEKVT